MVQTILESQLLGKTFSYFTWLMEKVLLPLTSRRPLTKTLGEMNNPPATTPFQASILNAVPQWKERSLLAAILAKEAPELYIAAVEADAGMDAEDKDARQKSLARWWMMLLQEEAALRCWRWGWRFEDAGITIAENGGENEERANRGTSSSSNDESKRSLLRVATAGGRGGPNGIVDPYLPPGQEEEPPLLFRDVKFLSLCLLRRAGLPQCIKSDGKLVEDIGE
eukprot:g7437.t1